MNLFGLSTQRDKSLVSNIAYSFLLKGISISASLLMVPLMLHYLHDEEYGIWLTISSLLTWISFFDIGLVNGLRNKLTEAIANRDYERGRIYLSTTFALLLFIVFSCWLALLFVNYWVDWSIILNTQVISREKLSVIVLVTFSLFLIQFVVKNVGVVFIAFQRYAISDLLNVIGAVATLLIMYLITFFTNGSLLYVAAIFTLTPVVVFIIAHFFIFYYKYPCLRPSIRYVKFKYSKALMGVGLQFFVIQMTTCLIIFCSSNIIITQLLGPKEVTLYNIAFKYFSVLSMGFTIVIAPLWSAYTEAFVRNDYTWIKQTFKRTFRIWIFFVLLSFVLLFASDDIYNLWIGNSLKIPFDLSIAAAVYVSIFNLNNTATYFLNGVEKIRLQLYVSIITSILYIPLTIYLGKKFGVPGVLYAMSTVIAIQTVIHWIQSMRIQNKKAFGLWNK